MSVLSAADSSTVPAIGFMVGGILGAGIGWFWWRILELPVGKALLQASTFRKKDLPEEAIQSARRIALVLIVSSIAGFFIGLITLIG